MTTSIAHDLPLEGLRVIELSTGRQSSCGRLLADLGAEVVLVEPPGGLSIREQQPVVHGLSLRFAVHHAGKRSVQLDFHSTGGRAAWLQLLGSADLVLDESLMGQSPLPQDWRQRFPQLVVLSMTDFGHTGPYRHFIATNAVHTAMAGALCRSGRPGLPPLLPPGELAWESAAVQAAYVALLAVWQRRQTGGGGLVDYSIHEAVAQVFDPAMGVTGSAQAGKSALDTTPDGRPVPMPLYPIIPCQDGHVRICVLNPRQWAAMSQWLGDTHPFTDPSFGNIAKRMGASAQINAEIAKLFSAFTAATLVAEGQARGVPIAAVASPAQAMADAHFRARGAFTSFEIAPGVVGRAPSGFLEIDGQRCGARGGVPAVGQHTQAILAAWHRPPSLEVPLSAQASRPLRRPLEGLRVLDLGVIVAGAEAGRMLADQGAEVIKVENSAFPDGGRQSMSGDPMTCSIAQGHRNKHSMGVNLRSEGGRALFMQLVAQSDVLLSNFKPGTLESLGLGWDTLGVLNPRLVMMDSSALGNTGPQSRTMGYGPLVRSSTGLTSLWRYPEDPESFSDGVTIYPDHLAGRLAAAGVLALLMRRERTGRGGTLSISQAEIFFNACADGFLRESLQAGTFVARGNVSEFHCPDGLFACAGEDQWCVVCLQDDALWPALARAISRPDLAEDAALATAAGRLARRAEVEAAVQTYTVTRTPREVTAQLQAAGVPAGFMLRFSEYRADPQFVARGFIHSLKHPLMAADLPTEGGPALAEFLPLPGALPAPLQGQHTRELAQRVLGLSEQAIESALAAGDLEDVAAPPRIRPT